MIEPHGAACETFAVHGICRHVSPNCVVNDGTHHSDDRIIVYRGEAKPVIMCGKHVSFTTYASFVE